MRRFIRLLMMAALVVSAACASALATVVAAHADGDKKKVTYRKTQEVNFDGSDVNGKVNSPDAAYLLQKRGVKFLPLYKVNNQFEQNILDSVEYLK